MATKSQAVLDALKKKAKQIAHPQYSEEAKKGMEKGREMANEVGSSALLPMGIISKVAKLKTFSGVSPTNFFQDKKVANIKELKKWLIKKGFNPNDFNVYESGKRIIKR